MFVAFAYQWRQLRLLGELIKFCVGQRPPFVVRRWAWDETSQRVTLNLPGVSADHQRSSFQVMAMRQKIAIGFENQHFVFELAFPQLLVTSTSAAGMWRALHTPNVGTLLGAVDLLMQRAEVSIDIDESDAAGANDRLEAHMVAQSHESRLKAHKWCSLHQNQLVEAFVLLVLGGCMLSRLYSLVLLLHARGYFLRMLKALPGLCAADKVVVHDVRISGPPPASAHLYIQEVMSYMVMHYRRFERASSTKRRHHWIEAAYDDSEDDALEDDVVAEFEAPIPTFLLYLALPETTPLKQVFVLGL